MEQQDAPIFSSNPKKTNPTHLRTIISESLGGIMMASCLQPLDVIKTRLQLDTSRHYRGIIHCGSTISQTEGMRALWKGFTPHATNLSFKWVFRMCSNVAIQSALINKDSKSGKFSNIWPLSAFGAGVLLETFVIVTPLEVVKTRLQEQRGVNCGVVKYKSALQCGGMIIREEGLRGLWAGAAPTLVQKCIHQAAILTAHKSLKQITPPEVSKGVNLNPWSYWLFGLLTILAAPVFCNPFDVVKTRLMAEGGKVKYKGMMNGMRRIYAEEGLPAFWKGTLPRLMWIPPGAIIASAVSYHVYGLFVTEFGYYVRVVCLALDIAEGIKIAASDPTVLKQRKTRVMKPEDATQNPKRTTPPYMNAMSGSLGGIMEACCLQPIDVIKTRLQLDRSGNYKGILHCGATISRTEGVRALWKGLTPFATHLTLKYALRMGSNAVLQSAFKDSQSGKLSGHGRFLSGFGAGVLEALVIVTPFEVVKIRLQQQKGLSPEFLKYKGAVHCGATIIREEGVRGLWAGATPTVMRNGTNQAAMFSAKNTFDVILWKKHEGDGKMLQPWQSMISGFLAGTVGPICTGPFDVVKTRLMAQTQSEVKYKGMVHALRTIYAEEGLLALWKGLLPRLMRIPPGQAIVWAVSDQIIGFYETRFLHNHTTTAAF
ncbi:mitochondrial succinate-fumarate transporter 1 [Senna tora]|uniref:Mitochondrial succinate-fumarate transporter 1 n=1 Tax=Senna tora TaxID=362788 RepID=A0A834T6S3_9FABA|nr:mitochondrial succinate-fumarate transporter 1 [Senna tora]